MTILKKIIHFKKYFPIKYSLIEYFLIKYSLIEYFLIKYFFEISFKKYFIFYQDYLIKMIEKACLVQTNLQKLFIRNFIYLKIFSDKTVFLVETSL